MNRIAKLADRLVDRLAPQVTADAACIVLNTGPWKCAGLTTSCTGEFQFYIQTRTMRPLVPGPGTPPSLPPAITIL